MGIKRPLLNPDTYTSTKRNYFYEFARSINEQELLNLFIKVININLYDMLQNGGTNYPHKFSIMTFADVDQMLSAEEEYNNATIYFKFMENGQGLNDFCKGVSEKYSDLDSVVVSIPENEPKNLVALFIYK